MNKVRDILACTRIGKKLQIILKNLDNVMNLHLLVHL